MSDMNRRTMFAGAGLLAAASLLSACAPHENKDTGAKLSEKGIEVPKDADKLEDILPSIHDLDGYRLTPKVEGAPTVTMYTDYQCPYCSIAEPNFERAAVALSGKMNVTVKHFPLAKVHKYAVAAAVMVQAANEQGGEMRLRLVRKLFEEQEQWANLGSDDEAVSAMKGYAKDVGLDMDELEKAMVNQRNLGIVTREQQEGLDAGVTGTPSFVVNGKVLEDVDSGTSAEDLVDAFMKAAGM